MPPRSIFPAFDVYCDRAQSFCPLLGIRLLSHFDDTQSNFLMTSKIMQADTTIAQGSQVEPQELKNGSGKKEDASTLDKPAAKEKSAKPRHRASVACASCRDRRIRVRQTTRTQYKLLIVLQCVVPPGQKECTQCKRSGVECVIKNDDERRRSVTKNVCCAQTDGGQANIQSLHVLTHRACHSARDDAQRTG